MERKDFIKNSCLACGLGIVGITGAASLLESCKKTNTSPQGPSVNFTVDLNASSSAALGPVGGYIYAGGVIIAHTATSVYIAIAQECTHAGCSVTYSTSPAQFICPCHGGVFDTSGNVVSGPPPAPLKKYTVTQSGYILKIAG